MVSSFKLFSCVSALLLALALAVSPAQAGDDEDDQDEAHAAVQSGAVMPLAQVLERLAREVPGQVLEVELERDHGRWVYEIKLLQPGGRRVKLQLDAASGTLLRERPRDRASDARR